MPASQPAERSEQRLVRRLEALIPGLEYSRETHVQWRDCPQKWRDLNPDIGTPEQHQMHIDLYDERIAAIKEAILALSPNAKAERP